MEDVLKITEVTQCQVALKCGVTESLMLSIKKNLQHGSTGPPQHFSCKVVRVPYGKRYQGLARRHRFQCSTLARK
jgi:hypothetical protein